ncbi:hypothetical protein KCU73_g17564, partial [Aureobasidium melanogenum]
TSVIYPDSMSCSGGETVIIQGATTVVPGPTVITDCPCTKPTTIYVPGPTTTLPASTITGDGAASSTEIGAASSAASISGSGAMTSGASSSASRAATSGSSSAAVSRSGSATSGSNPAGTSSAATSYQTAADGINFLVQKGVNYNGTPLNINAKRQAVNTLSTCLDACAGSSLCVATSFNTDTSTCLYFSAIDQSSQHAQSEIVFAIATSRLAVQSSSASAS